MKLFQKSALAVAIAAVPFLSVNAMEALDDATLSEMTGQAGVTIETQVDSTGITIGSIQYTDTDSGATGEIGGGSLLIDGDVDGSGNGIRIRGWSGDKDTGAAVGSVSKQTIDINSNGDLITETVQIDGFGGADKPENSQRIEVGAVNLVNADGTAKVSLVSNLDMVITSGSSSAHILNTAGGTDLASYDIGAAAGNVNASAAAAGKVAIITRSESRIDDLSVEALDGAIGISGLRYGGGPDGTLLMESTQVIWANGGDASTDATAGVFIQGSDSVGTLVIDSVSIGQGTIGSVKIANISQAGSTMRIYGH